jgi:hypothetical protein
LTAGDRIGSMSQGWSVDTFEVSLAVRVNFAGTGSTSMTVHGASFAGFAFTVSSRGGYTGCESTEWESETSIRCSQGHAGRGTRRFTMTLNERGESLTHFVSFDVPGISMTLKSNRVGTGSVLITMHASNFGLLTYTASSRGGISAAEVSNWLSDSAMACRFTDGNQGSRRTIMTAGERPATLSSALSTDILSLSFSTKQNRASTGSKSLTLLGGGFGGNTFTATLHVGFTSSESTKWQSHSSLVCQVSRGIENTKRVVVTMGEEIGTGTESFTTDVNQDFQIRRRNIQSTGSISLTVYGAGLGQSLSSSKGRLGASSCESTDWTSQTSTKVRVSSGSWATRRVTLTVGEAFGTMSSAWSIDSLFISFSKQMNGVSTGSASLTLQGSGFGMFMHSNSLRSGKTACEETEWESQTSLRCLVATGILKTRRVSVTAGERGGSVSQTFSVDHRELSFTIKTNRAGTGTASVTVHGAGLGLVTYTNMGREGQTGCEGTEWESETSVRCMVGHGTSGSRRVVMTAGNGAGSLSHAWSVESAAFSHSRKENRPGTGSASVTVHGAGLGLVAYTSMGREGQTGCEGTEWESETSVRCMGGHWKSSTRRVVMTAGLRGSSVSQVWSVDKAMISTVRLKNRAGTGSASLTVHAASLGLVAYTSMGRGGQTGCEGTEWESETSVRCMVGQGHAGTRRVVMTAGERTGSISQSLSFDSGFLNQARRSNRAGTGSASVTVHGAGLGLAAYTSMGREGQTGCEGTEWESETSVRCMVGHGYQRTRRLIVTGGMNKGSLSSVFSHDLPILIEVEFNATEGSHFQYHRDTGTSSFTLTGFNFGMRENSPHFSLRGTGAQGSRWLSTSSIQCKFVQANIRGTRIASITSGLQVFVSRHPKRCFHTN